MSEEKKEIRKGTASLVIAPFSENEMLRKAHCESASKQITLIDNWMVENQLVPPPYDPVAFLRYMESNVIYAAVVNRLARDVTGTNYRFVLKEDAKESQKELDKVTEFISTCSTEAAFRNMLYQLMVDWGAVGYFAMEVIRNLKGEIAELGRVPAFMVKVHKSNLKYAQVKGTEKVWFKKFGVKQDISFKTGEPVESESPDKADEMVFYKNFYSLSAWYGTPDILPAIRDVLGLIESSEYNFSFFKNYGVPAGIMKLKGDWAEDAVPAIQKFFKTEVNGSANGNKTLIMTEPEDCTMEYTELSDKLKDSSFQNYARDNKENILSAYSMPPQRVGIQVKENGLGGNTTTAANKIYVNGTVEPLQTDIEDILNNLFAIGLGITSYKIKFDNLEVESKTEKVARLKDEIAHGISTPNQARAELGQGPYEGGDTYLIDPKFIEIGVDGI